MFHPLRLISLGAGVLVLAAAPAAGAAVRSSVTVHNQGASPLTWNLKVKLAKSARLVSANGFAASRRTGTVTLTPRARKALAAGATRSLTVTVSGRRAPAFSAGGKPCSVKRVAKRRTVRCVLGTTTAAGAPTSASAPATTGGGTTTSPGGGSPAGPSGPSDPGDDDPGGRHWPAFAPYVDVSGWPPPDWAGLSADAEVEALSLGFVTAENGTGCVPTWGGYTAYPAFDPPGAALPYELAGIQQFEPVPSFGGAAGTELAIACTTPAALAAAYQQVIDAYDATHIDFDIEGAAVTNTAANARRAAAIKLLQDDAAAEGRTLRVAFTVAVIPAGLDDADVALLEEVADAGVDLSLVNLMAMNYGASNAPNPDGNLDTYAQQAAVSAAADLTGVFPDTSLTHIGLTPMIGRNDTVSEVFTLDDAQSLTTWASTNHLGMMGMWSGGRDHQCTGHPRPAGDLPLDDCSDVAQADWAFSHVFGQFTP